MLDATSHWRSILLTRTWHYLLGHPTPDSSPQKDGEPKRSCKFNLRVSKLLWRKLHEKIYNDQLKEGEMVYAWSKDGIYDKHIENFSVKKQKNYLLNLGVDARIILKQILK